MEKFKFRGRVIGVSAGTLGDYEKYELGEKTLVTVLTHAALDKPVDLFREISGEDEILPRLCSLSEIARRCPSSVLAVSATLPHGGATSGLRASGG